MRTILEATSSKLGFLKGDEDSKLQPYLEVFQEHVKSMVKPHVYERIKNKIRFEYPGFIRGKTFGGKTHRRVQSRDHRQTDLGFVWGNLVCHVYGPFWIFKRGC